MTSRSSDAFVRTVAQVDVGADVYGVAWSPDAREIALGCADGLRILNLETETLRMCPTLGREGPRFSGPQAMSVAWSVDGRLLATENYRRDVVMRDRAGGRPRRVADLISGGAVAWAPDGRCFAYGVHAGIVIGGSGAEGENAYVRDLPEVRVLVWSPDGRSCAAGFVGGGLGIVETGSGQPARAFKPFPAHDGEVWDLAWAPDGSALASVGDDATVRLWDRSGTPQRIIEGHTGPVCGVDFNTEGELLASLGLGELIVWRCDTWEPVWSTEGGGHHGFGLAFADPHPLLAARGPGASHLRVFELDTEGLLRQRPRQGTLHYTTAKIALVGDSGVGKTGLGWRLAHGEYKEQSSTHGQQFWVIDDLRARRSDGTECEAVLWDLAGQRDYRLVHALYLEDVDLALVLFDPGNEQDPLKGVEYWLNQLAPTPDSRVRAILVAARIDVSGTPPMTTEDLEAFCRDHRIAGGYVATSARRGDGLGDLLDRIRANLRWDDMTATVTTTTFKRIKDHVLGLKEAGDRQGKLVDPVALRARLEASDPDWEFSDAEVMASVGHLANHGYVTVLRRGSDERTILLAPELLATLAASLVQEARANRKGLGALDEERVVSGGYWPAEPAELAALDAEERAVVLDAVVSLFLSHNVCFRETLEQETLLVFPALINQKRPVSDPSATIDGPTYLVTGAVENVYSAVVVLLGYTNTFSRTNQWQDQAQYETSTGHVCGFRQVVAREGEIVFELWYGPQTAEYSKGIFEGLLEKYLAQRDVTVLKYPVATCRSCGYSQARTEVVKRMRAGTTSLRCVECGEPVTLPMTADRAAASAGDGQRLHADEALSVERTAYEAALVRVKRLVSARAGSPPRCFISYAWGDADDERWVARLASDLQNAGVRVVLDRWENARIGDSIPRFMSTIEAVDFVAVIGTPAYREKYENEVSRTGSMVAAEVDLINVRLTGTEAEKSTVLPVLLRGTEKESLPPLLHRRVACDFRGGMPHFAALLDLVLTLHGIPVDEARELRESVRRPSDMR